MKTNNKLVIDFLAKKNFRKFALYPSIFFTFDSFSKHSLISWRPMIDELDVQMSKISFRHPCLVVRLFSRIDCLLTLLSSKIAIKIIFKRRKHEVYEDGEKWVFFSSNCVWLAKVASHNICNMVENQTKPLMLFKPYDTLIGLVPIYSSVWWYFGCNQYFRKSNWWKPFWNL